MQIKATGTEKMERKSKHFQRSREESNKRQTGSSKNDASH